MKVLMITGDKNFAASERFALQAAQVEKLEVLYMGWGHVWPKIPAGIFDVVTAQDPFWRGLFAWIVARRIGATLNIQVHTSVVTALGKFILRKADSIRVVSEKIKKQVEGMGITAPIRVLPVYIDVSKFQTIAPQPHDKKTILWIGRFENEKDPLLALEIISHLPLAKLIMLGAGSLQSRLKTKAKKLPVEFPGWQDPAAYLAVADVVISTSRNESYGASMIEALAAGVPVVAPDVGIAAEAGAIVVSREKMAQAVIEVLKSGQRGTLKLQLPGAQEWAKQWRATL